MDGDINPGFKRILWYVFFATRGGFTRIKIVDALKDRPYNIHQLSKNLNLDYKTVTHHIKILEDNKIIIPEEKKYGTIYFHTQLFEQAMKMFDEIREKVYSKGG